MKNARNETSWTPPGLPAPGPGEPAVETLISVARGIARGAPWYSIAESRDLDFEEIRLWPWKFSHLWEPYIKRARKLQREELADSSLNTLGALQNGGTAEEIRRACDSLLRYDTMMKLINQKTATADGRGLAQITPDSLLRTRDSCGEDDDRAFLPRLPVLMPRGPNRTPRCSPRRYALPTPEAIALLRKQLKDPDPNIAHRAARTTLIHDARLQSLEARWGETAEEPETADARGYTPITEEPLSVREAALPALLESTSADVPSDFALNEATRGKVSPDTGSGPDPPDTS